MLQRIWKIVALAAILVIAPYRVASSAIPAPGIPAIIEEFSGPYSVGMRYDVLGRYDSIARSESDRLERDATVRILLLLDDGLGANYDMPDTFPSIKKQFEQFGWKITTAALTRRVERCDYCAGIGLKPIAVDYLIGEISDVSEYDIVCLLPGSTGMSNVLASPAALSLIRTAAENGLIIAAWCKSVRVLAAAGLLKGIDVVGHADFKEEYQAAGAAFLGNDHPPVTRGNIITSVRGRYYRTAMCEAMRDAVAAKRSGPPPDAKPQ